MRNARLVSLQNVQSAARNGRLFAFILHHPLSKRLTKYTIISCIVTFESLTHMLLHYVANVFGLTEAFLACTVS